MDPLATEVSLVSFYEEKKYDGKHPSSIEDQRFINWVMGGNYAPVTWKTMCPSKEQEGLGLRDTRSWNDTFLTKILGNVHAKKDTLWYRWIHLVYVKSGLMWDLQVKKAIEAGGSIPKAIGRVPSCHL
ncbi:hypothetical protein M9H77_04931 [Catharanthus roseus]|uniref:Uncharacterized protein n=1 Tax=Catharanthus roseus TaxID=4058 RepID=A0ACC0CFW9_CATRO|nr:hypothetical protein M9H77_04931 [Catharanthus roseus]